jgi:D-alanyl-D-alanine carboxypeptidase (penicillin-binding protein 5/6)
VGEAPVLDGVLPSVPMQLDHEVILTLPRLSHNDMKTAIIRFEAPAAPIKKGSVVGQLVISMPGHADVKLPLQAASDVARLDLFGRLRQKLSHLIGG